MKARVLLTYASPLFNTNWESTERRDAALTAALEAEKELTAAGYGLYGSSASEWQKMFTIGATDNTACKEAIMIKLLGYAQTNAERNGWENSIRLTSQEGSGGVAAPMQMVNLFPMADGSRPTVENGYDENLFFLNRDPRFYRTFAFSGIKWGNKQQPEATVWTYRWTGAESGSNYFTGNNSINSPAFVYKMSDQEFDLASRESYQYSGTNIFEFRYAELLLIIAECYAAKGDINNCLKYLGQVRARVGIPSANNYGIGTLADKYAALEAVLYERRVELAYEGKRYWDMQRWMLYGAESGTVGKLRVAEFNGTNRKGYYLQVKSAIEGNGDPLLEARASLPVVDPDAATFTSDLRTLADFWSANFEFAELDIPMDQVSGQEVALEFKENYYIHGLRRNILANNPWIEQTKGWMDDSNREGTYDYQK